MFTLYINQFLNFFRMKTYTLVVLGFFMTLAVQANELPVEFSELDKIEYLVSQEGLDMESLKLQHPEVVSSVNWAVESNAVFTAKEMPVARGFWWGCCLGVIGLALVYIITDNNKQEVKSALIGCVVSALLFGIGGLLDPFNWF